MSHQKCEDMAKIIGLIIGFTHWHTFQWLRWSRDQIGTGEKRRHMLYKEVLLYF